MDIRKALKSGLFITRNEFTFVKYHKKNTGPFPSLNKDYFIICQDGYCFLKEKLDLYAEEFLSNSWYLTSKEVDLELSKIKVHEYGDNDLYEDSVQE